jgi:O-antigen ligase
LIFAGGLRHYEGRADWPSLFVFAAALLLLVAALLQGNIYRWGAILLLVAGILAAQRSAPWKDGLSIALGLFCAWLFLNAAFLTPSYSAEALYRPLILLGGYAAGLTMERRSLVQLFWAGVALLALLVLLGLLQFYFGFWHLAHNPQRAAAMFVTPNTFATAINLILLPLAALFLVRGSRWAYVFALWMFAGLIATESRGGWLAALAGLWFIAWYQGIPRTRAARAPWLQLLAGLLWVYIAFWAVLWLMSVMALAPAGLAETFAETVVSRGTSYRVDIAMVALSQIAERPLAGAGASMFRNLMEMTKPAELDMGQIFMFVHNDYLQIWVEFGLVGIILLGAVMALALVRLARSRRAKSADLLPMACGAALASVFAHAVVDFPLYIPFLLLLVGLWLGALSPRDGDGERLDSFFADVGRHLAPLRSRIAVGGLTVAALAWLAQPAIADFATGKALAELSAGRPDSGLYWQSVARRFEPQNGAHYWTEAIIWRDQAIEARDKPLAARADMLLSDGMRADPYQIANYIERSRLHRLHADLFDRPVGPDEVLDWTGEALRLRPYSLIVQAEHARALAHAGRIEEATRIVHALLERHRNTGMARGLAREFGLQGPDERIH